MSYKLTTQIKDSSFEDSKTLPLAINKGDYLNWLNNKTKDFYSVLWSPERDLTAKGLVYSTQNATFAKILVSLCNVDAPNNTCADY